MRQFTATSTRPHSVAYTNVVYESGLMVRVDSAPTRYSAG